MPELFVPEAYCYDIGYIILRNMWMRNQRLMAECAVICMKYMGWPKEKILRCFSSQLDEIRKV